MKKRWFMALPALFIIYLWAGPANGTEPDTYIKVEIMGIMRSFPPASEETKGVEITAAGATWELDFKSAAIPYSLRKKLEGKMVVITGEYRKYRGLEMPERHVVTVKSLKPAGKANMRKGKAG